MYFRQLYLAQYAITNAFFLHNPAVQKPIYRYMQKYCIPTWLTGFLTTHLMYHTHHIYHTHLFYHACCIYHTLFISPYFYVTLVPFTALALFSFVNLFVVFEPYQTHPTMPILTVDSSNGLELS